MFKKTLIVILCLVCVTTFLHSQNAVKLINESETERIEIYESVGRTPKHCCMGK